MKSHLVILARPFRHRHRKPILCDCWYRRFRGYADTLESVLDKSQLMDQFPLRQLGIARNRALTMDEGS